MKKTRSLILTIEFSGKKAVHTYEIYNNEINDSNKIRKSLHCMVDALVDQRFDISYGEPLSILERLKKTKFDEYLKSIH